MDRFSEFEDEKQLLTELKVFSSANKSSEKSAGYRESAEKAWDSGCFPITIQTAEHKYY